MAKWHCGKVAFWGKKNPQPRLMEIADRESVLSFCSDCEWTVAHTTRGSEGGQSRREDADNDLNNGLPSFFFHFC